jgi:phosphoenolpyruvate carboxylase
VRQIPATMATQHPDNAGAPTWSNTGAPFIGYHEELAEVAFCFRELGVSEYMWDWEGKHADAAVIDRLFAEHFDYFSKKQLGRDKFLTFRIPNIWAEQGYSLLQAMTVILSSEDLARDLELHDRPLFEVILPLTERASQLIHMQHLFAKLARFKSNEFTSGKQANTDYLELIPLLENVETQHRAAEILTEYVAMHEKHFKRRPEYIRPFLACSDPALTSGLLATVIANKVAIVRLYEFAEQTGIPVFPIAGPGSLPFRGGLTPLAIDRFLAEFPGVRTVTVQSSFRYDFPTTKVRSAIAKLERELGVAPPAAMSAHTQMQLVEIGRRFGKSYWQTVRAIAEDLQPLFVAVPKRRDRRQHIGLSAYSRGGEGRVLPRAITFTAGFYSIGVPPELIGVGRALRELHPSQLQLLRETYPNLATDLARAGRYLNVENIRVLERENDAWGGVRTDVESLEEVLDLRLRPRTIEEVAHHELSSDALLIKHNPRILSDLIGEMAKIRRSVG